MDSLFAPWRMEWVKQDRPDTIENDSCTFCALPDAGNDRKQNIVARSEHTYILLNNMPYNPGHVMVIPFEHTGEFHSLDETVLVDQIKTTKLTIAALEEALSPHGYNLGCNIGAAGGASITHHLHMHIIPRWGNDTSFMPLTANTAIVEEAVQETFIRLRDALLEYESTAATNEDAAVAITHR